MNAYPIKFTPILKEKIWGGDKLKNILGKTSDKSNLGESWEISDVEENISVVSNGAYKGLNLKELISWHQADLVGASKYENFGNHFPLLIKFLDAKTDLSVQVHPDNNMAKKHHNSLGKTEMWYIMNSDQDADIILGLKDENTNPEILKRINAGNVDEVFNREKVNQGDSFFIPAGKIHAIGAGVLAAEIQQTSDITYRVYDWDRKDAKGNKRELHIEQAKKATKSFETNCKCSYDLANNGISNLVSCEFFTTNIFKVNETHIIDNDQLDSFVIYMCVEGQAEVTANEQTESIKMGETILIPANSDKVIFDSEDATFLEVYID